MKVAFQPSSLLVGDGDQTGSRLHDLCEPGADIRLETLVLDGEGRGSSHHRHQGGVVLQGAVVDQRRHRHAAPFQDGEGAGGAAVGEVERSSLGIDPSLPARHLVCERERGVVKGFRQRVADAFRRG